MTGPQRAEHGSTEHGGAEHGSSENGAEDAATTRLPRQAGTDIAGTDIAGAAAPADDRRAAAAAVLDRPLDDGDLASRVHRPGMARSTWVLLAVLLAVGLVALGTWIGRATAQRTGPGSMPDVVGTVESVGAGQVTVRGPDGKDTVFTVSAGTKVAAPTAGGVGAVRVGQQVTVSSERNRLGGTDASLVEMTAP